MHYISTRGSAPSLDFAGVLLAGLARDGGLYVPASWPSFSPDELRAMRGLPYPELAARVMQPFVGESISFNVLREMTHKAYANFAHPAIVPMVQVDHDLWSMELFHGPTLAFKDMAMQMLGLLFDYVLGQRGEHVTIVGATSGDTGSAAIEACRDRKNIHVVILHPKGRTSDVQRRQMTTVHAPNIANLAVEGTFDDCQDMVKSLFADEKFRTEMNLSAVNSINWARIAAQIPYYVAASLALGGPDRPVSFAVPTGNFGNVLAAWVAGRIGVPIARLIVGSNRNDILTRFFTANDMSIQGVEPSLSPSMDIQVSSNFERILFELLNRDPDLTAQTMRDFRDNGRMRVAPDVWQRASQMFHGARLSDQQTLAEIRCLAAKSGYLADPHSAIGIAAGRANGLYGVPTVAMATAHPAKFPDAMAQATGTRPALPPHLVDLFDRTEYYQTVPNDAATIQDLVRRFRFKNQ